MDQTNLDFFEAAASGDFAKLCAQVSKGANVNIANGDGRTALMRSAKRGYTEIVRFLLDNGADTRARDKNNKTALMGAAKKGHTDICRMLIHAGANIDAHDNKGRTALMRASLLGHSDTVKYLISKNADVNAVDEQGRTALMEAVNAYKLDEIKAVGERCTVLRRGRVVGTVDVKDVTGQELAEMMVGRAIKLTIDKEPSKPGRTVLSIKNLNVKNSRGRLAVRDLSLDVRAGEIVGIAGVDGNGQSELIYAITGLSPVESGSIILNDVDITKYTIRQRIEAGISHVPEDRQKHGFVSEFTAAENIALKNYYKHPYSSKGGLLNYQAMHDKTEQLINDFDVRCGEGALTLVGTMSGGNKQKVIIAREIELAPDILIFAQPTRGLDVGAISYIHKRIVSERDKGIAVLLISFELDEIMNLCDRIATISDGSIAGIFNAGEVTEREIGVMMAGSKNKSINEAS